MTHEYLLWIDLFAFVYLRHEEKYFSDDLKISLKILTAGYKGKGKAFRHD